MASTSAYSRSSYSRHGRVPSSTGGGRPQVDILEAEEQSSEASVGSATNPSSARGGSAGNSRQEMLERQRELQKNKTRNRMAGGVVQPHSALNNQAGSAYGGGRGRTVPQYSAPQQRPGGEASANSPGRTPSGAATGSSVSNSKQEEEAQSTETPSVEDVLRNRQSRKSSKPEPKQDNSPTLRAMNERNIQSTYDPNPESTSARGVSASQESRPQDSSRRSSRKAAKDVEQPIQPRNDVSESSQSVVPDYPFDFSDMKSFLTSPLPIDAGIVQCYIERKKSGFKWMYPEYYLYMKNDDRFLLAAKKRAKQKTSNYLMSMDKGDMNRDSPNFLGKVRSNLMGTEFVVYDDGQNPSKASSAEEVREELGVVTYASHLFSTKGPRKMKAAVPVVDPGTNERVGFRPGENDESIADRFKDGHIQDMVIMVNKPPKWNEYVGAYVLNFGGRVTMASVKNFQLVTPEDHDRVILQFGRTAKDLFTMDVRWPLSPLQAFGICVSSFDYKLACD